VVSLTNRLTPEKIVLVASGYYISPVFAPFMCWQLIREMEVFILCRRSEPRRICLFVVIWDFAVN
jgi:hypothetical protein